MFVGLKREQGIKNGNMEKKTESWKYGKEWETGI